MFSKDIPWQLVTTRKTLKILMKEEINPIPKYTNT